MRRFRFPLSRVLTVREKQAGAARSVFAAALVQWHRAKRSAATAEEAERIWHEELSGRQRLGMLVAEWEASLYSNRVMADRTAAAQQTAQAAAAQSEEARSAYTAARQRAEALQRLWVRHFGAHQAEAQRQQQLELDAIALSRHRPGEPLKNRRESPETPPRR